VVQCSQIPNLSETGRKFWRSRGACNGVTRYWAMNGTTNKGMRIYFLSGKEFSKKPRHRGKNHQPSIQRRRLDRL